MRPDALPEPTKAEINFRIGLGVAIGCIPLAVALLLNVLRPDLVKPMLQHIFGYTLGAVTLLCIIGGFVVYIVAAQQKSSGARIGISVAGFFVCTLPAIAMMLFGPVVFAFMYGSPTY
jgi:hypothetical protein